MSSIPNPFGPPVDPIHEGYRPRLKNSTHCEAAKDLLLFMRATGIRCTDLTVGKDGVSITGLQDDYPRKQPPAPPAVRASAAEDDDGRLYEDG
jgi:hypothetical protein